MKREEIDVDEIAAASETGSNTASATDASPMKDFSGKGDETDSTSDELSMPQKQQKIIGDDQKLVAKTQELFVNHRGDLTDGSISTHESDLPTGRSPVDVVIVVEGGMQNLHHVPDDAPSEKVARQWAPAWTQHGMCLFSIVVFVSVMLYLNRQQAEAFGVN